MKKPKNEKSEVYLRYSLEQLNAILDRVRRDARIAEHELTCTICSFPNHFCSRGRELQ
jgi:hypothetical protein